MRIKNNRNKTILLAALSASLLPALAANANPLLAYQDQTGVAGLQAWNGSLGMDFDVVKSVTIKYLGVFDNGIVGNLTGVDNSSGVTVQIYDRSTGLPVGLPAVFTPGSPGMQSQGDAVKLMNLVLPAGFQGSVVTFNDVNYNTYGGANGTQTLNNLGGAISFTGASRYGFGTSYPSLIDNGPANRYDAGTFGIPDGGATAGLFGGALVLLQGLRRKLVA